MPGQGKLEYDTGHWLQFFLQELCFGTFGLITAADPDAFMHFPTFPRGTQWNNEEGLEKSGVKKGGWGRKLSLARLKLSEDSTFRISSGSDITAA